jgi:hypothetical protein
MWLPLRTTRRFRAFILAAFIHQLNACPCGCLEQNGWYLAIRSLAASASLITLPVPTTFGLEDFGFEEDHCDGDARLTFVGQQSSQLDYGTGLFWFPAHANTPISSTVHSPSDSNLVSDHAAQPSALEVRARCPVLRI